MKRFLCALRLGSRFRRQAALLAVWSLIAVTASATTVVVNPYADVDWEAIGQHKANLHTHTTQSDGRMTPTAVIDEYHERGYSILALTDHNRCTWPWTGLGSMERFGRAYQADRAAQREADFGPDERTADVQPVPAYEDRDPEALGMLAVAGNEPSNHHHMGSYFIEYETRSRELEQTLAEVGEAGGLAMLFHPGRYWDAADDGSIPDEVVQNYADLYTTYDHLFGMEVINQGNRYKMDIPLWDQVLAALMPERPVWGHANDDMHSIGALGRDWSVFLLTELNEETLRSAMLSGRAYFSSVSTHAEAARDVTETPVIQSIVHDETAGTLTVSAESGGAALPDDQIKWISMGEAVHTGPTLDYKNTAGLGNYVRAELTGNGGTTFTNPFGLQP